MFLQAGTELDLPYSLVYGCFHWLSLQTGVLEIRSEGEKWSSSDYNWRLDVRSKVASCGSTILVDPKSRDFRNLAAVINGFEGCHRLVVHRPNEANLTVNLPRYDMSFVVNKDGHLESGELRAIVDPDQNIGTLHGLQTKLVLRNISSFARSILIPRGKIMLGRSNNHAAVFIDLSDASSISYCKHNVNAILRRLDPPAEMADLLRIAYLHSLTTHVEADDLTGRTGTYESFYCLESVFIRMWKPLDENCINLLRSIAKLTPRRCYYPVHLKNMQTTIWNDRLTFNAQHDDFRYLAEAILAKSRSMLYCHFTSVSHPSDFDVGSTFLLERNRAINCLYKRQHCSAIPSANTLSDKVHEGRDKITDTEQLTNVFEAASLLKQWTHNVNVERDLMATFQSWTNIGRFNITFECTMLTDLLNLDFASNWGSMYLLCQNARPEKDRFRLLFMFSTIAFRSQVQKSALRTLIAIAVDDMFRDIKPPSWQAYELFCDGLIPTLASLTTSIEPQMKAFDSDAITVPQLSTQARQEFLQRASVAHNRVSSTAVQNLAGIFASQWPQQRLSDNGIPASDLYVVRDVINAISPWWLRLYQNMHLSSFVRQVQNVLNEFHNATPLKPQPSVVLPFTYDNMTPSNQNLLVPSLRTLLQCSSLNPDLNTIGNLVSYAAFQKDIGEIFSKVVNPPTGYEELGKIISSFTTMNSASSRIWQKSHEQSRGTSVRNHGISGC